MNIGGLLRGSHSLHSSQPPGIIVATAQRVRIGLPFLKTCLLLAASLKCCAVWPKVSKGRPYLCERACQIRQAGSNRPQGM